VAPLAALACAWAAPAFAAGGGNAGDLGGVVLLVVMVGVAYLLAHVVVDRLQRRFLLVTGVEYALLGLLMGPTLTAIPVFLDPKPLAPVIALAAGWVGLAFGARFDGSSVRDPDATRIGIVDALITGGLVAAGTWLVLTWAPVLLAPAHTSLASALGRSTELPDFEPGRVLIAALVLGCAAAARSTSALDLVRRRYGLTGGLPDTLERAGLACDTVAVLAFGLIFCVWHSGESQLPRMVVWGEWVLLTQLLGGALGLLFSQFFGEDERKDESNRFLALVGIITFASGAAFYLNLSPLLVNFILAVVMVRTSPQGRSIAPTLERSRNPVRLLLLVFAGALIVDVPLVLAAFTIAATIALRFGARAIAGWFATIGTDVRRDVYRGTLAQGDIALAMAISYRIAYHGPEVDIAYVAIVASVLVNELFAPRTLKGLLVDAGEIRSELPPRPAATT
jgi:hypothetical protein